jgi:hypothetical protein
MRTMMNRRRGRELLLVARRLERTKREDAAGRLVDKSPDLTSLSISIRETRTEGYVTDTHYIRRIVIAQAPALFEVWCSNVHCDGIGYDLTAHVLASLAARRTHAAGMLACTGHCGALPCTGVLRYETTTTFGPPASSRAGRAAGAAEPHRSAGIPVRRKPKAAAGRPDRSVQ